MSISNEKYYDNNLVKLISIIVFITNLTQLPKFHGSSIVKLLLLVCWGSLLCYLFYNYTKTLTINNWMPLYLIIIFDIYIILCQLITDRGYISSNFVYPVNLSVFIFYVSYFSGQRFDIKKINKLVNAYFISCLVLTATIYLEFFKGVNWLDHTGYVYGSKNSISQIVLSCMILLLVFEESGINKILKYCSLCFFFIFLLMIKSRSALIALIVSIFYIIFFGVKNKKRKFILLIITIIFIAFVFLNENLYELFINQIILNNKEGANIDTISSGRVKHFVIFLKEFPNNIWLGNGGKYLESFPLASLLSYGLIGGSILFLIALSPVYYLYIKHKNNSSLKLSIKVIFISMLVNSLFEELPPFGPGAKCYVVWMLLGLYLGINNFKNKTRRI